MRHLSTQSTIWAHVIIASCGRLAGVNQSRRTRSTRVYIGERGQNRIQVFTTEGQWLGGSGRIIQQQAPDPQADRLAI
jgi:hypothetical protein